MQNRIYYGDNLDVLRRYIKDETIDLCYIDPPFNSKRNYNQIYNNIGKEDAAQAQAFIDTWTWDDNANIGLAEIQSNYNGVFTEQSIDLITGLEKVLKKGALLAYLVSMTLRIAEIHRVLKPTGSFYLHCDPTASHYLKLVLDAIFCVRGGDFLNEIIWNRYSRPKGSQFEARKFGNSTDTILFYSKTNNYNFSLKRIKTKLNQEDINKRYNLIDERGRYYSGPILRSESMGARPNLVYEYKGFTPSSAGWRMTKDKVIALDEQGDIFWTTSGIPRRKVRLQSDTAVILNNLWDDIEAIGSQAAERLGYPTQKPEALLERVIKASSDEGDVILDAYCGCGTTVAVAQRLKRQWIGIDITYQSISLILKRLEDQDTGALENLVISGVPKDFEAAIALAKRKDDRTRKEFEKWIVLTYSKNRAIINEKKGGDGGIDGIVYVVDKNEQGDIENKKALFSVKSNEKLTPAVVRELFGTVEREKAACGILLTLHPMPNLVKECKKYGNYQNNFTGNLYPKIQIICVQEILDGKFMDLPNPREVLKKAEQHADQMGLLGE